MSDKATMIANIKNKLDELPFRMGISDTDLTSKIESALNDAVREMRLGDISNITPGSDVELYVEIRAEWYYLKRVRNSELLDFRYSTGNDGRSVDKSMIPKMVTEVMNELDAQYKSWLPSYRYISGTLNLTRRESERLAGDE